MSSLMAPDCNENPIILPKAILYLLPMLRLHYFDSLLAINVGAYESLLRS